jgi:hypothetical protein
MIITRGNWFWRVLTTYARVDMACGVAIAAFLLLWLNLR